MSWSNALVGAILLGAGISIGWHLPDWWADVKAWWRKPAASRFLDTEF